ERPGAARPPPRGDGELAAGHRAERQYRGQPGGIPGRLAGRGGAAGGEAASRAGVRGRPDLRRGDAGGGRGERGELEGALCPACPGAVEAGQSGGVVPGSEEGEVDARGRRLQVVAG